jgi:hypothetical protein
MSQKCKNDWTASVYLSPCGFTFHIPTFIEIGPCSRWFKMINGFSILFHSICFVVFFKIKNWNLIIVYYSIVNLLLFLNCG